jgi:tetratricopeptide (TPR) repeat protein
MASSLLFTGAGLRCALAVALAASLVGCASIPWRDKAPLKYETVATSKRRDVKTAQVKHAEALAVLELRTKECCLLFADVDQVAPGRSEKHLLKAENLLNEALVADVRYGPAHNSLGMVYYLQDKLYLAAWEFEYAAKLMPEHAQPYNNLGLVYERAGKYEEAISYYSMAMSRDDDDPQVIGNLVRARLTTGEKGSDLKTMISDLALYHPDPTWQQWARDQVALAKFDDSGKGFGESWDRPNVPEELPAPIREKAADPPVAGPKLKLPESVEPLDG